MSLNCLSCQAFQRTNSDSEEKYNKHCNNLCCVKVERSWSGNLAPSPPPPPYEQMRNGAAVVAAKKVKKNHRRLHSTGGVGFRGATMVENGEPRLIRSCGMRRDWSFENLKLRREEKRKQVKGMRKQT